MYSIGDLGKLFHLSRSTLLYYSSIGLLEPSKRTDSNYRMYSQDDANKLKRICLYRETGMSLDNIKKILDSPGNIEKYALEMQLEALNASKKKLELQQKIIVQMLSKNITKTVNPSPSYKKKLVDVLKSVGLDQEKLIKLHADYEKISSEEHLDFLKFLQIPESEICQIIEYSKQLNQKA